MTVMGKEGETMVGVWGNGSSEGRGLGSCFLYF